MTTLFVAISGGHLAQLHQLSPRLGAGLATWVTDDTSQSRSLLAGQSVDFIPTRPPRDWIGVMRDSRIVLRAMRAHKVTRVISTGSQIALSAYLAAKLLRVPFAYVESATRVTELSTTGKILDRVPGVYRYVQHTSAAPSSKWRVALSVFDGFNAESTGRPRPIRRVVVTLGGNGEYAFGRLIERIRDILPADAEVLWQLGSTPDQRLPGRVVSSIPSHELFEALTNADVVIGHAGTGTAITALSAGKLPVLSPRQAAFGEHVDGHQEDLARALADLGLAVVRHADDISLSDLELAAERIVKTSSNQGPVDLFAHGTTPARRRKSH